MFLQLAQNLQYLQLPVIDKMENKIVKTIRIILGIICLLTAAHIAIGIL